MNENIKIENVVLQQAKLSKDHSQALVYLDKRIQALEGKVSNHRITGTLLVLMMIFLSFTVLLIGIVG